MKQMTLPVLLVVAAMLALTACKGGTMAGLSGTGTTEGSGGTGMGSGNGGY
jgi:hypothetical protein